MNRAVYLGVTLCAALAGSTCAQSAEPKKLAEGTPVVIVGMISSQPRDAGVAQEKKMQVAVGPSKSDYTLHLKDARLFGLAGQEVAISDLQDKWWVRAEGRVMDDPRRIDVSSLRIIGKDLPGLKRTAYYRSGFDQGYVAPSGVSDVRPLSEGTPVVVVGKVSSPPKGAVNEKKMQVAVGPAKTDYTLHFSDANVVGFYGEKLDEDGLDDKMWVRAVGTVMDDPRRIKVTRVQVIGKNDEEILRSAFSRPGLSHGYVTAVAGTRQTFPLATGRTFLAGPVTIIGRVSDDTGTFETSRKIQVMSGGNEWTLDVVDDASVRDAKGEKISVHEIKEGQWVRVHGWRTDDLRLRVYNVENIGADEAFRKSQAFRAEAPLGYVERSAAREAPFHLVMVHGTVSSINRGRGFIVVQDERGAEHRIYTDSAEFTRAGSDVVPEDLKVGDRISVHGYTGVRR